MLSKLSLVALIGLNSMLPMGMTNPVLGDMSNSDVAYLNGSETISPRYSYQSSKTWPTKYGNITTTIQVDANTGYIQSGWASFPNNSYIFSYRFSISSNKYSCTFSVDIANKDHEYVSTLVFPMTSPGPR